MSCPGGTAAYRRGSTYNLPLGRAAEAGAAEQPRAPLGRAAGAAGEAAAEQGTQAVTKQLRASPGEVWHTEEAVHIATPLERAAGAAGEAGAAEQPRASIGRATGATN